MTSLTTELLASNESQLVYPVLDLDVHETFRSWNEILPYLQDPWRRLLAQGAWTPPSFPFAYWTGHGLNRADSNPADGASAGSDFELFKEQVLDRYAIEYAVLTGQFMPGDLEAQFELASALASAYNDWVLEHWVSRDPRVKTSIHVTPQDPQAAAREIDRKENRMHIITITRKTTAKPQMIWELWANVERRTRWDDSLEYARADGPFRTGMSGVVRLKGQPERGFEIVECVPHHRYTDRFFLPLGGKMDWVHTITEVEGGYEVTFDISAKGPTSFLLGPIMKNILGRELPPTVEKLIAIAQEPETVSAENV